MNTELLNYAEKNLLILVDDGDILSTHKELKTLYITTVNGHSLELSDNEVEYQALEYLRNNNLEINFELRARLLEWLFQDRLADGGELEKREAYGELEQALYTEGEIDRLTRFFQLLFEVGWEITHKVYGKLRREYPRLTSVITVYVHA